MLQINRYIQQYTYSLRLLSSRLTCARLRLVVGVGCRLVVCVLFEPELLSSNSLSGLSFCNVAVLLLLYVSRITINIKDTPLTLSQTPRRYAFKIL